jgi:hypothetical protein
VRVLDKSSPSVALSQGILGKINPIAPRLSTSVKELHQERVANKDLRNRLRKAERESRHHAQKAHHDNDEAGTSLSRRHREESRRYRKEIGRMREDILEEQNRSLKEVVTRLRQIKQARKELFQ